jgi:hypothetical protein
MSRWLAAIDFAVARRVPVRLAAEPFRPARYADPLELLFRERFFFFGAAMLATFFFVRLDSLATKYADVFAGRIFRFALTFVNVRLPVSKNLREIRADQTTRAARTASERFALAERIRCDTP